MGSSKSRRFWHPSLVCNWLQRFIELHKTDLSWLNAQVEKIWTEEPTRSVILFTHHASTMGTGDPKYAGGPTESAFATELSNEQFTPRVVWCGQEWCKSFKQPEGLFEGRQWMEPRIRFKDSMSILALMCILLQFYSDKIFVWLIKHHFLPLPQIICHVIDILVNDFD